MLHTTVLIRKAQRTVTLKDKDKDKDKNHII